MENLNWRMKPTNLALKSWKNEIQTKEDVINWHKLYTPWLND
jgi:hypothetical protein